MSERTVAFTESAARRVAAATKAYERGNNDMPGIRFRQGGGDDGEPVRLGKTTSTWAKDTLATINVWEDGTPPNETQTSGATLENCVNKMVTVPAGRWVEVVRGANGYWYLVAAEPTQLDVIVGVTLGSSGLEFQRKRIYTFVDSVEPTAIGILVTSCD
jgi:hypothetical protein